MPQARVLYFLLAVTLTGTICTHALHIPSELSGESAVTLPVSGEAEGDNKFKIVCYYTSWSQYRPGDGRFLPEDIDPNLCTHINFAFAVIKEGLLVTHDLRDESRRGSVGMYEKVNNLKKVNPNLKTLLAVGGYNVGSWPFQVVSSSSDSRQKFISHAITFLRDRNFDGLDVDWEYPLKADKEKFVDLLKELKEAFEEDAKQTGKPRLLLTATVPAGPEKVQAGYDVPTISEHLDFINLMSYDFHGQWEHETGHNSPLYAPSSDTEYRRKLCTEYAAKMWVDLGAPKNKLIIGVATYGRSFTLSNPRHYKVNAPATGGGEPGEFSRQDGILAYYEICQMQQQGGKHIWDDEMKVPYIVKGNQWVGYDDERSIRDKMIWVKMNRYGGVMVWTLDFDDFAGRFCKGGLTYPLIGAVREELTGVGRNVSDRNRKNMDVTEFQQNGCVRSDKFPCCFWATLVLLLLTRL